MSIRINIEENTTTKKKIDYDDILKNMGMREVKGKLFWEKNNLISNENFIPYEPGQRRRKTQQHISGTNDNQNSYIHNKYFKNEFKEQPEIQRPANAIEYRNMIIRQIIEQKRINQIKSRQMIFR